MWLTRSWRAVCTYSLSFALPLLSAVSASAESNEPSKSAIAPGSASSTARNAEQIRLTSAVSWLDGNNGCTSGGCDDDGCTPIDACNLCPPAQDNVFADGNVIDGLFEGALGWKNDLPIPIKLGAWHWFAWDLTGNDAGGYGIPGLRGTYWWEVIADPSWELDNGMTAGVHSNLRLRDGDNFRTFFDERAWFYELYGHISNDEFGKLKGGKVWKRFGLDWDGVFFGNVPYFDGFKLDPDWGLSWEKTTQVDADLSVDTFVQFFFHEDGVNGSFGGGGAESTTFLTERNTGVVRIAPTWSLCDDAKFTLGLSGLVGELDSNAPAIVGDQVTSQWALDATYAKDNWKVFGEVLQSHGIIHPTRFVSGGPSNRITNFLTGAHYRTGPVLWRASYSLGIDDNPYATDSLIVAGATIDLTKHVDLYIEYVNQQVDNHATANHIEFFDSLNFIFYWSF